MRVGTAGCQGRIHEGDTAVSCGLTESILDIRNRDIHHSHVHSVIYAVSIVACTGELIYSRLASGDAVPRVRLTCADIDCRVNRIDMIYCQDKAIERITTEAVLTDRIVIA